jgi:hypothetical protein
VPAAFPKRLRRRYFRSAAAAGITDKREGRGRSFLLWGEPGRGAERGGVGLGGLTVSAAFPKWVSRRYFRVGGAEEITDKREGIGRSFLLWGEPGRGAERLRRFNLQTPIVARKFLLRSPGLGVLTGGTKSLIRSPGFGAMTAARKFLIRSLGFGALTRAARFLLRSPGLGALTGAEKFLLCSPGLEALTGAAKFLIRSLGFGALIAARKSLMRSLGTGALTAVAKLLMRSLTVWLTAARSSCGFRACRCPRYARS